MRSDTSNARFLVLLFLGVGCVLLVLKFTFPIILESSRIEITDKRIIALLDSVKAKGNVHESIHLYVFNPLSMLRAASSRPMIFIQRDSRRIVGIHIDTRVISSFSDEAFRGALAHELGHLVLGHDLGPVDRPDDQKLREEIEADAFAVKIVGKNELIAALKGVGVNDEEIGGRLKRACEARDG